ncbi:MAG: SPOR domain-containing protein [Gammaproteobacteria bacterium]|nr:SPOR domain-containing protein [Gammaproteobacteria bacterium]
MKSKTPPSLSSDLLASKGTAEPSSLGADSAGVPRQSGSVKIEMARFEPDETDAGPIYDAEMDYIDLFAATRKSALPVSGQQIDFIDLLSEPQEPVASTRQETNLGDRKESSYSSPVAELGNKAPELTPPEHHEPQEAAGRIEPEIIASASSNPEKADDTNPPPVTTATTANISPAEAETPLNEVSDPLRPPHPGQPPASENIKATPSDPAEIESSTVEPVAADHQPSNPPDAVGEFDPDKFTTPAPATTTSTDESERETAAASANAEAALPGTIRADPRPTQRVPADASPLWGGPATAALVLGLITIGALTLMLGGNNGETQLTSTPLDLPLATATDTAAPIAVQTTPAAGGSATVEQTTPAAGSSTLVATAATPDNTTNPATVTDVTPPSTPPPTVVETPPPEATENEKIAKVGQHYVQLLATPSVSRAMDAWKQIQQKHNELLGSEVVNLKPVELRSKGVYYRVTTGAFDHWSDADQLCSALKKAGQDCLVVRSRAP